MASVCGWQAEEVKRRWRDEGIVRGLLESLFAKKNAQRGFSVRSAAFSGTRQRIVVALNARSVSTGMISPLTTSTHTAKAVATVWKTPPSCADPVIPQKEKTDEILAESKTNLQA
jgi:hypothetical protein